MEMKKPGIITAHRSMPPMRHAFVSLCAITLFASAAYAAGGAPVSQPSSVEVKTFDQPQDHFRVQYPGDWTTRSDPQNVLTIDGPHGSVDEISLAVPKLPAHIPDLIPLGSVERGYIDDCKKRMSDVKLEESRELKIAGASARHFEISAKDKSGLHHLLVTAIVRGDTLYIVTGDSTADNIELMRTTFEQLMKSWTWIK